MIALISSAILMGVSVLQTATAEMGKTLGGSQLSTDQIKGRKLEGESNSLSAVALYMGASFNLLLNGALDAGISNKQSQIDAASQQAVVIEQVDDVVNEGGSTLGKGFDSFNDAKKFLGSPGEGNQWHHIVEQSQIQKSGFESQVIQNTDNLIAVDKATHAKISGYYNTKSFDFTGGLSVRNWLAGQSFEKQYEFGMNVLKQFGVTK